MPNPAKTSPSRSLAMRVLFHIHKLLAESDGFVDKPAAYATSSAPLMSGPDSVSPVPYSAKSGGAW